MITSKSFPQMYSGHNNTLVLDFIIVTNSI